MKKRFLIVFLLIIFVLFPLYLINVNKSKEVDKKNDENIANCDNYQDAQQFESPVPIVWTAKFDGNCLSSCWGASFTKVPEDSKYPRFSGYVSDDGERIADEYLKEDQILKIYGNWVDVSDSYGSVFDNKCVPTVEIEKIEIVSKV